MSGTIFGLPMSQRVDVNGLPSIGWHLYLYQANTSTPVQSYQDTALTVLNAWPLTADSFGMLPIFWLADGSYRARATNADGSITYFDQLSVLALGASAGAAPSGGVDAATIFQTGDVLWLDRQGTRVGWVRDNGRTIGSATSGGAERANADCQPLFEFLWNNYSNTVCPVGGGRGASSLADWSANKQISTPDRRGRGIMGLDDMGNSAAGRFGFVPFSFGGDALTPGSIAGDNRIIMTAGQLAPHSHTISITDPGHAHSLHAAATQTFVGGAGSQTAVVPFGGAQPAGEGTTDSAATGISASAASTGTQDPINNVASATVGTFYRKL